MELNSSVLGSLLKPRDVIKVDLPPNTKSWFYQFYTGLNDDNTNRFKKLSSNVMQVAALASTYYSAGASNVILPLLTNINIPTGEAAVSVYCLDEINKSAFLRKASFRYLNYGNTENKKQGLITVPDAIDRNIYIGIKNTSSMQRRVYVTLQVYAIVEREKVNIITADENGWSFENKNKMFNRWFNEAKKLGYNDFNCLQLALCTQTAILSNYSFNDYKKMGIEVWNQRVSALFSKCERETKK